LQYLAFLLGWDIEVREHFANTNKHPSNTSEADMLFMLANNKNDHKLYQQGLERFGQQMAVLSRV
jgi:hypothetical protein